MSRPTEVRAAYHREVAAISRLRTAVILDGRIGSELRDALVGDLDAVITRMRPLLDGFGEVRSVDGAEAQSA